MSAPIINIIIGLALVVAGFSGFTLIFTGSQWGLVAFGVAIAGYGVYQLIRYR